MPDEIKNASSLILTTSTISHVFHHGFEDGTIVKVHFWRKSKQPWTGKFHFRFLLTNDHAVLVGKVISVPTYWWWSRIRARGSPWPERSREVTWRVRGSGSLTRLVFRLVLLGKDPSSINFTDSTRETPQPIGRGNGGLKKALLNLIITSPPR